MTTTLTGVGGAPGIAIGNAARLNTTTTVTMLIDANADAAMERFEQGRAQAAARLRVLGEQLRGEGRGAEAGIFDAQALLAEDDYLSDGVTRRVREEGATLETALAETTGEMRAALLALDDPYLRARAADIDAVGHEIQLGLGGEHASLMLAPGSVIIADDLTPSQTAALRGGAIAGFATASGGPTGHTAILARSLGIPAAVGLGPALLDVADGTPLILDGSTATVLIEPTAAQRAEYQQRLDTARHIAANRGTLRDQPGQLADGTSVALWANIGDPAEAHMALANGAEGIGLFRTEFLFLDRTSAPTEAEQYVAYRATLEAMLGRTVVARTLDIGGDKPLPYIQMPHEANPFLGVRALRLCMQRPDLFQTQLRALLRAAAHGDLWIMLPMIALPADLAWGREQVRAAAAALAAEGIQHRADPPIGIMIETPAAAITADLLAREAAFFSVGSNDLAQYTLAVDRGQAALTTRYPHDTPAVLRLIGHAAEAARSAGIPIGVCGELAGEPDAAVALAGLGINELSMAAASIPAVKERLAATSRELARASADRMRDM